MNASFEQLSGIIRKRRSVKPADMNGVSIDNGLVRQLLELADWAPTHARTEPWRFAVYEGKSKKRFCLDHAELYRAHTSSDKFMQGKYDKLKEQADTLSHIIVVYMKRTPGATIPVEEELAAVAAATQNLLLGAAALNIAALWSTGGMTHHPAMKTYLGMAPEDIVMGLLFLGYTDKPLPPAKRNIPLAEKIRWQ
ncbi:nitroreductase family protein [Sediminibacterium soli]|uniref:nitroreductase family protein n=1 Tax=Sediminibacterium soli TaxID=2698829 RepID=UPI00137ACB47|nr:nitroreductase [Sediminibacterium soli]NCI45142.1 nitroreductase [Sediminibacterium soli]